VHIAFNNQHNYSNNNQIDQQINGSLRSRTAYAHTCKIDIYLQIRNDRQNVSERIKDRCHQVGIERQINVIQEYRHSIKKRQTNIDVHAVSAPQK